MGNIKYLKGECSQCHEHLEFPADAVGTVIDCPHCGHPTELLLSAPTEEPGIPRRTIVWTIIAVIIMAGGLAGLMIGLNHFKKRYAAKKESTPTAVSVAPTNPAPPVEDPIAKAGFRVSEITLEKTPGSSLIYAVGTVSNRAARQRFGVKVELDLFNAAGEKVGTAKDYQQVIEPKADWHFKALVVASKATSAKLVSIKEDQ